MLGCRPLIVIAAALTMLVIPAASQAGLAPIQGPLVDNASIAADVAVDTQGNTLLVWSYRVAVNSNLVQGRRVSAGGEVGPVFDISTPGQDTYGPQVGFAANGRAYVAWTKGSPSDPYGVEGRWVETDNSLASIQTIATGGGGTDAGNLLTVVAPTGVATVLWKNNNDGGKLVARRIDQTGAMGTAVSDFANGSVTNPQAVALPDGATLAAWRGVQARVLSASGVLGAVLDLDVTPTSGDVDLSADGQGNTLVTWRTISGADHLAQGRFVSPDGAIAGSELTIDPAGTGGLSPIVEVAADSDADFLVTWSRQDTGGNGIVYARKVNKSGVYAGPAQTVSSADGNGSARSPAPVLTDRGIGAVGWWLSGGSAEGTQGREVGPLAEPVGNVQNFASEAFDVFSATAPAAGVGALVSLQPTGGATQALYLSRFLVPPVCSDVDFKLSGGATANVPVSCTGPATESVSATTQPKHGSLVTYSGGGFGFGYKPADGYTGADSFTYLGTNDGGASANATVKIADRGKPIVRTLKFTQMRPKPKKAKKRKKSKRVYKFGLTFSEDATVRLTVEKPTRGVRKGKRCLKRTKKRSSGKRCTLYRSIGTLRTAKAADKVTLTATRKLARTLGRGGKFRVSALATDAVGGRSVPKRIIIRARK